MSNNIAKSQLRIRLECFRTELSGTSPALNIELSRKKLNNDTRENEEESTRRLLFGIIFTESLFLN